MMNNLRRVSCLLALSSNLYTPSSASPSQLLPKDIDRALFSRQVADYPDCTAQQKPRLVKGFADAAQLAQNADGIQQASNASLHYLRPADEQSAKSIWTAVGKNSLTTNAPYKFSVRCAKASDKDCKGQGAQSLAITDSKPQEGDTPREMKICPRFFTATETKSDLDGKTYDKAQRARNSWCKVDPPLFISFETAGHTLLHEMTHLDAVGRAANLQPRGNPPSRGTDDVTGFGDDYVTAARGLLDAWVNSPGDLAEGALQPFQNAENLAAAATEWWFTSKCGYKNIVLTA